eukprot:763607-Hanusia_phi.AAC.1
MRARELVFKNDMLMLTESRKEIRRHFLENSNVEDAVKLKQLLQDADEAADMLRHQIVQGERKGEGEYAMNIDPTRHVTMDPNKLPVDSSVSLGLTSQGFEVLAGRHVDARVSWRLTVAQACHGGFLSRSALLLSDGEDGYNLRLINIRS